MRIPVFRVEQNDVRIWQSRDDGLAKVVLVVLQFPIQSMSTPSYKNLLSLSIYRASYTIPRILARAHPCLALGSLVTMASQR